MFHGEVSEETDHCKMFWLMFCLLCSLHLADCHAGGRTVWRRNTGTDATVSAEHRACTAQRMYGVRKALNVGNVLRPL